MTLHPAPSYSTRALSFLLLAAFAGLAMWLFMPWDRAGSGIDGGGNAALPPSLRLDGEVRSESTQGDITRLTVPVTLRGDEPLALADGGRVRAETLLGEGASAAVPATYVLTWLEGDGDSLLEPAERALLTIDLPANSGVRGDNPLRLVIFTGESTSLIIEDVLD